MGSTDLERQRRHRAHKRGNHDLCHPDRCEALKAQHGPPETAPEQPKRVTAVTRDAGPAEAAPPAPAGPGIAAALASALREAPLLPRDAAAAALVRRYAEMLDAGDPDTVVAVGPRLLRALESLGMTPAGRGTKGGMGDAASPAATKLDELRDRRAKRAARAGGAGAN